MSIGPETSISSLEFSRRTTNSLERAGILTYGQLKALFDLDYDFHQIRGLGEICIKEILCFKRIADLDSYGNCVLPARDTYSFGEYVKTLDNTERNWQILADYCNGGREMTLEKLGEKYGLTRERVRQLATKRIEKVGHAVENGSIRKEILEAIDEAANKRTEISLLPAKDEVFTRPGLARLLEQALPERYKIIKHSKLNGEWFTMASDNVEEMLDLLIVRLKDTGSMSIATAMNIFSIPEEMLLSIDGVVESNGYISIIDKRWSGSKDRHMQITEYLESISRPASITEISERTGLTLNQVRGVIQDKYRYVNVGKSVYDLVDREYEGVSVEALAINILSAEMRPLKIGQIVKYVQRYSAMPESSIYHILTCSSSLKRDGEYFGLDGWKDDGVQKLKSNNGYLLALDEAIFDVVSSVDTNILLDSTAVKKLLEEKYGDAVSMNESTIKATLSRLANERDISRVGINTGCFARSSDLSEVDVEDRLKRIKAKYQLGLFLRDNIGKTIEIRYKTDKKNSDQRWRRIEVSGQSGRYIFTKNMYNSSAVIKYVKERVVDFRAVNNDDQETIVVKQSTQNVNATPQSEGWYEDVKSCVERLGNTFTLAQVYDFEDELHEKHPENNNVQAKIRQQLQELRNNSVIEFLQAGVYRKVGSTTSSRAIRSSRPGDNLVIGGTYSNDVLMSTFKVSGQGGMRKSNITNSLVLIAKHKSDNPYDDGWSNGDHFEYTGMGMNGDQSVNYMQNRTVAESNTNGVTMYLFESFADNSYIYRGVVKLDGEPYYEIQIDESGDERRVVKFSLKLVD